jgi:hypothetical protein
VNDLVAGAVAGAAGTTALNVTTYLDMAVRGRPASTMPEEAVKLAGDKLGVPIAPHDWQSEEVRAKAANRQTALGALAGLATGISVGALYGLARGRARGIRIPVAGVVAGLGAMALSDVPLAASGLTDPRQWGVAGWASDVVPHLVYGFFTALTFDALRD